MDDMMDKCSTVKIGVIDFLTWILLNRLGHVRRFYRCHKEIKKRTLLSKVLDRCKEEFQDVFAGTYG